MTIKNVLKKLNMKLGTKVRFSYNNNLIIGTLIDKKNDTYLVDIDTINNVKQTDKTVITVTTTTVLEHIFKNS